MDNRPDHLERTNKSSPTDEVTQMDRASERLIREVIAHDRPFDSVIGEEDDPLVGTSDVTWLIDPIDGTTNYVYDHPGYAVSIAALLGERAIAGVVSDPTHTRTYSAIAGEGSFCNGRQLRLPDESPDIARTLVATGFNYDPAVRTIQGRAVAELIPVVRDIRRMGAAAVDLCSVASGRVDAYYEKGLSPWDLAAGLLIAAEAGARTGAMDHGEARADSVLVAHPDRFDELRELLQRIGAD